MLYVSCGTCAPCDENTMSWCNENKYNAVHRVEEWIKETNFVNYFLIYRPSLHIQNNVSATIDEMSHLLARLNHLIVSTKQNIEIIWIHLHGSGRLKSSKHMFRQTTKVLRKYDAAAYRKTKELSGDFKVPVYSMDIAEAIFSAECRGNDVAFDGTAARCACGGIFESPDGTHLSMQLQLISAQMILGFIEVSMFEINHNSR